MRHVDCTLTLILIVARLLKDKVETIVSNMLNLLIKLRKVDLYLFLFLNNGMLHTLRYLLSLLFLLVLKNLVRDI